MTKPRSERQDGDGLPLEVRIQTARYAFFRLLRAIAPHERLREEWSKLEALLDTPPSGNARERAGGPYSSCADLEIMTDFAPPQPAPDAMREALIKARALIHVAANNVMVLDSARALLPELDAALYSDPGLDKFK